MDIIQNIQQNMSNPLAENKQLQEQPKPQAENVQRGAIPEQHVSQATINGGIDIVFKDIHFEIWDKKTKGWRKILNGVSGEIKAGECLGIMGASGAGKSTLLNIISGRIRNTGKQRVTGEVLFNGKKTYWPEKVASISGYVLQQDILNELLTVQGKQFQI